PQKGNLGKNETGRRRRDECGPMAIEQRRNGRIGDEAIDDAVPVAVPAARRDESAEQPLERTQARAARKLVWPANAQRVRLANLQISRLHHAEQPPLESTRR